MTDQLRADDVEAAASDIADLTLKFSEALVDFETHNSDPRVAVLGAAAAIFAGFCDSLDIDVTSAFEQVVDALESCPDISDEQMRRAETTIRRLAARGTH